MKSISEDRMFLRPSEIAPLLGLSAARIYQLVAEGRLPATRVAGSIRIPKAAWESWVAEQTSKALAAVRRNQPGPDGAGAEALRP